MKGIHVSRTSSWGSATVSTRTRYGRGDYLGAVHQNAFSGLWSFSIRGSDQETGRFKTRGEAVKALVEETTEEVTP